MYYFLWYLVSCLIALILLLIADKVTNSDSEDSQIMFFSVVWPLILPFAAYFLLKDIIHRVVSLIERKVR